MSSLVEIAGENTKPQVLASAGPLTNFGINPYSECMFRVVWSDSRRYLVGSEHTDYDSSGYSDDKAVAAAGKDSSVVRRRAEYRYLPLYPNVHAWVLEKWMSAIQATGCTPEKYELDYKDFRTGLYILGPYPYRGEYYHCFTFPSPPTSSTVHGVIRRIIAGWNYSFNDHRVANREVVEKKQKDEYNRFVDKFKDSQQAFNNRASSVRPGKRTKDRVRIKRSADQIGLHQRGFSTR